MLQFISHNNDSDSHVIKNYIVPQVLTKHSNTERNTYLGMTMCIKILVFERSVTMKWGRKALMR